MKTRSIDCIKMKDDIQFQLAESRKGMNNRKIVADIQKRLKTSDDPMAKLWRKLTGGKVYTENEVHAFR